MTLADLAIGDIIITGDGFAFICIPTDDGPALTDGDMVEPCATADGMIDPDDWRRVDPDDQSAVIGTARLAMLRALLS